MEAAPQQLPTVRADTNRLLNELEQLAERVSPATSTPREWREPVVVIQGK